MNWLECFFSSLPWFLVGWFLMGRKHSVPETIAAVCWFAVLCTLFWWVRK